MAEEEATLSQARKGAMKDVVELMPRGAPKAVVALVKMANLTMPKRWRIQTRNYLLTRHIVITLICEVRRKKS